ncbi:MAG TPA: UbiA-like polyprenyltransferase [Bacteroidia bacterium]|nr:UbiA-like polyprenyltransferase [Bacteroidia bacterium]HRH09725.1 UbiA-like polyprenyltransferase [Bacteroidia bacterium]
MPKVTVQNYLSLIKFSHTVFALPFAIIGFLLGTQNKLGIVNYKLLILVIACMVFARSAAMAFNRYIDRHIDKINPRTFVREIPSGVIQPSSALYFVIVNCVLFISCTYFINPLCFYLSPIALLVVLGYSYTKRFTALCHLVLGTGLALAPIGAYLAVTGSFNSIPLYFSFAVLFWVSGFDIIYALQDEEFDKQNNLQSIPVIIGKKNALTLASVFHLVCATLLLIPAFNPLFGLYYKIGLAFFIALLLYQHSLVKANDLSKINLAFFTTNGIASVVFAVFFILDFIF